MITAIDGKAVIAPLRSCFVAFCHVLKRDMVACLVGWEFSRTVLE